MKIMRYFPIIALAILCFIGYSLYKTGRFINKKVDSETLLTQDSLVQTSTDVVPITTDTTQSFVSMPPPSASDVVPALPKKGLTTQPVVTSLATTPSLPTSAKEGNLQAKKEAKKGTKSATKKATSPKKDSATMQPNAETFKAANALAKKTASEPRFHVVVGTFTVQANAKAQAQAFEQKTGKKPTIVQQGKYFRVCADAFEFAQAATQYSLKLKEAGEDNIIVKF